MNFDFENNRYFGHATSSDPTSILEKGLSIYDDIYGNRNLFSTTTEINEEDIINGNEYLVKDVFSVGTNFERKYLVIISYEIGSEEIDASILSTIDPQNIVGYYDENAEFYQNINYYYYDEMSM